MSVLNLEHYEVGKILGVMNILATAVLDEQIWLWIYCWHDDVLAALGLLGIIVLDN